MNNTTLAVIIISIALMTNSISDLMLINRVEVLEAAPSCQCPEPLPWIPEPEPRSLLPYKGDYHCNHHGLLHSSQAVSFGDVDETLFCIVCIHEALENNEDIAKYKEGE